MGSRVVNSGGGRGSIEPPKTGGAGELREKGSVDRTIHQLLWALARKVLKNVLSIEDVKVINFFSLNDDLSEAP